MHFISLIFFFIFTSMVFAKDKTYSQIEKIIEQMTNKEKIAQLIIVRTYASEPIEDILKVFFPGGFIHHGKYNRDGGYSERLREMNHLQNLSLEKTNFQALFMVDQEGGPVNRFPKNTESGKHLDIASFRRLGATNNTQIVQQFAEQVGHFLHVMGFNMNLAPVVDIFRTSGTEYIAGRSFGSDPHFVQKMSHAFTSGLQKSGIIAVFKHFPGYSNTVKNSHNQLVTIHASQKELMNMDWIPYQFKKRSSYPQAIISNIAIYPHLDKKSTATLSKKIITELLKDELGYKGLIISDDIGMKGYKEPNLIRRATQAILAGHDMILLTELSNKEVIQIYRDLVHQLKENTILRNRVHDSLKKIFQLKSSLLQDQRSTVEKLKSIKKYEENIYKINTQIIRYMVDTYFKNHSHLQNSLSQKLNVISFSNKKFYKVLKDLNYFKHHQRISLSIIKEEKRKQILAVLEKENYMGICYGLQISFCDRYSSPIQKRKMIMMDSMYNPPEWDRKKYKAVLHTYGPSLKAVQMILEKMIKR